MSRKVGESSCFVANKKLFSLFADENMIFCITRYINMFSALQVQIENHTKFSHDYGDVVSTAWRGWWRCNGKAIFFQC